jgi:hypothetical protein
LCQRASPPSPVSNPRQKWIHNIANWRHRYRPRNLLLTKLSPGPHNETADEMQRPIADVVTELVTLYDDGICARTPKHPNGKSFYFLGFNTIDLIHVRTSSAGYCGLCLL